MGVILDGLRLRTLAADRCGPLELQPGRRGPRTLGALSAPLDLAVPACGLAGAAIALLTDRRLAGV